MKKLIKIIALSLLAAVFRAWNLFTRRSQTVVLMYHSIGNSGWEFSVTPEIFEKQINYLQENEYKFLTAEDLYRIILGKQAAAPKNVLLTFDDGYRDFITQAEPILRKNKIPAVLFVHANRSADNLGNNLPLLSWEEIKSLSVSFEVGSHSYSHPDLKDLSKDGLNKELDDAEHIFLRELGYKPEFFSYPGGRYNINIIENLQKRGYKLSFTINPGIIRKDSNPLALPRFGLSINTSVAEFKARVSGASNWYEKIADIFRSNNRKKYL